ncbi:MAG: RidA family protein [Acidimicrobiia bacterium]|nr:RidA family protein [Acidimicrobiia bacterium]
MTAPMHLLPGQTTRRAGDLLYVSTIFPVDAHGRPVRSSSYSPHMGESDVYAQSSAILGELARRVEADGSSMDRVLRVEVQLAATADFGEFKLAWIDAFGDEPPARTTIVVGDDQVVPGARVTLNAVALNGDSTAQRETIRTDEAPDPMPYEHAPQAVKGGHWVYPSALPACDYEGGIPPGVGRNLPAFPYYANDATDQAEYVFANLQKVMQAAGTEVANIVKAHLYEPDLGTFPDVDAVWARYMPRPPTRASMAVRDLLVERAVFVANLLGVMPDESMEIVETRKGIHWHPVLVRKVNFTPGIAVGDDWLFLAGQIPVPDFLTGVVDTGPSKLRHYFSDIEMQTEATMRLVCDQIDSNGFELRDVVDAHIFLVHAQRDYRGFERAWRRVMAEGGVEDPPPITLIPSRQRNGNTGIMFLGPDEVIRPDIEIDFILCRS